MSRGLLARKARCVVAATLLLAHGLILAGCSTASIGDQLPTAIGGLPEGAPKRPETPAPYPAVHAVPPPRATSVLTAEEQQKLEDDLVAARKRAAGAAGKPAAAADTKKADAQKADTKADTKKADAKAAGSDAKP
jgi:hypothetical protein